MHRRNAGLRRSVYYAAQSMPFGEWVTLDFIYERLRIKTSRNSLGEFLKALKPNIESKKVRGGHLWRRVRELRPLELGVHYVEKAIGMKAELWAGKCHEVAALLLKKNVVVGKLRYGHWIGPVHPDSMFAERPLGLIHHGWIELEDSYIVDPTRWVFECEAPYVYIGKNDFYDAGGNVLRQLNMQPPPEFDCSCSQALLKSSKVAAFVKSMHVDCRAVKQQTKVTMKQMFWLANLPLELLGNYAKDVYLELIDQGYGVFIPIDNKEIVLGEEID